MRWARPDDADALAEFNARVLTGQDSTTPDASTAMGLTRRFFVVGTVMGSAACGMNTDLIPTIPMIVVDQPSALTDTAVSIELRNFAPRQSVTLTVTLRFPNGSRWQSRATFTTDGRGRVDVSRTAPTAGTYEGVAPMGFIWSAVELRGETHPFPVGAVMQPWFIDLEAEAPDRRRARLTIERRVAALGVTRTVVRKDGLVGILFLPPGDGPHPTVMVVSGGGGGIDEVGGAIMASRGYAAVSLGYFRANGLPRGLVNIPLEYFEKALLWIRAQPWFDKGLLAVWGPSRGGELALLLGATFPEINAVSAWVPSGVIFGPLGQAEPGDTRPRAAWTHRGQPLPYLQQNNPAAARPPVVERGRPFANTPFYRSLLQDARAVERATIPVERTHGPILLISGTDDQMWPSSELAEIAFRRLEAHHHPFPFRHLRYEGAGHRIQFPYIPTTIRDTYLLVKGFEGYLYSVGGTPSIDAAAGIDAWQQHLRFLKEARQSH